MQPSTSKVKIDLDALMHRNIAYVTTYNEFGEFLVAGTPEELELEYFKDKDGSKIEFFVSTSEDMISEEVKVLVTISDTFYHFFIDSLTTVLKLHRQDPSLLFVLYLQRARPSASYEDFLILLFKILDSVNVKYKVISTVAGMDFAPTYKFNNYIIIDQKINIHEMLTFIDAQYAIDLAIRSATNDQESSTEPFRKVYLTRGGKGANVGLVDDDYEFYKDDLRMYEEEKLEKFFVNLGYEVVEPETKFKSIMEQICYMKEVKTLVSVTCSGLANMIFMQPNQTVIEIQAELVQVTGHGDQNNVTLMQKLHSYYHPLSFMGGHTHISIPSDRNPEKVIQVLTKDALSYLL